MCNLVFVYTSDYITTHTTRLSHIPPPSYNSLSRPRQATLLLSAEIAYGFASSAIMGGSGAPPNRCDICPRQQDIAGHFLFLCYIYTEQQDIMTHLVFM